MKRSIFLSIFAVLIILPIVSAGNGETRVFVKSDSGFLKNALGAQHALSGGFTTNLNTAKKALLDSFGIEYYEIEQFQLLAPPGACSPWPACKGGGDDPTPEPNRTCLPGTQTPYGVTMVNGGSGGSGVNVAILDTGVNKDHLDLDIKLCKDATKRGIKNGCKDWHGHGTHVSGTVAANGGSDGQGIFGVAPDANLWMVKVCVQSGCWTDDMADAIYYVTDQGANIISMSIGGDTESQLVKDAIDYATSNGVLVIAAAGNDGPSIGSIDYPGANQKVMAIAAVDSNKNVASWSSRGINDGDYIIEEREVELAAPGVSVESTWLNGCYNTISGTSMATPHVAGLAAKNWQGNAVSTRTYLQSIAQDIHTLGDDVATGFGLPISP